MVLSRIRNTSIIAHIDHGKSTLADRLIQHCGAVEDREFRDQILDSMDIERERGITIKSNTVTLRHQDAEGRTCRLNLIDTPGHVDFSHEVRRSLMSCEGALLLIDASQGVEAQTVANLYLALEYDLTIIPVINKIDLPSADVDRVREEIESDLGLDPFEAVLCSAKTGEGVEGVLDAIVERLPPPEGDASAPLQALVFDAQYDPYRGVVMLVRVRQGTLRPKQKIRLMHTGSEHEVEEIGTLLLKRRQREELEAGAVGYVIAGIRKISEIDIGDTITTVPDGAAEPIPGYREAKPVVFSSIYPVSSHDYEDLTRALEKLALLAVDEAGIPRATVAGVLLCTRNPERWLPNACITATRYRGRDRASGQIDAQEITGPLNRQISDAVAFAVRNIESRLIAITSCHFSGVVLTTSPMESGLCWSQL